MGRITSTEDIGNVVVAVNNGTPVLLKDIGRVEIGIAPRLGEFGYKKQNDAVEGVILLRTGEKTQDVLKGVEAKTKELNEQVLPRDVKIVPFYDRSDLVALTTQTVEGNLLRGMFLVVVVLIFFLYDIKAGLIVAVTIPLALLFAFVCLDVQGASANLLSIGAIDFGILVDAAVVMVENIFRQIALRHGRRFNLVEVIRHAAAEVDRPLVYAVAVIVVGFLPIYVLTGPSGASVQADGRHHDLRHHRLADHHLDPSAGALCLAHANRHARKAEQDFEWITERYIRGLDYSLAHPWRIVGGSAIALVLSLLLAFFVGAEFMPQSG